MLLAEIIRAAPAVQILTTSRERLNLQGEQVYALQGLACPDEETPATALTDYPDDVTAYPAARLFLESARRARHGFAVTVEDLPHLGRICRLVDGMPLALELAASWTDTLSLADIAAEIAQGLDFLETPWQDVPQRHRSMTAVFDATWGRLSPAERELFAQLSVFRGGFTRQAARAATGASLRLLAGLVNKSLLAYDQDRHRYQVHELLRQYGAERLAADPARVTLTRERHGAYFCTALERWGAELKSARQIAALEQVEADLQNVRAAWEWAAAGRDVNRLDQALWGHVFFYRMRFRFQEGVDVCQLAIDALAPLDAAQSTPLNPDALRVAAMAGILRAELFGFMGRSARAKQLLQRSEEWLNSPALTGHDTQAERALLLRKLGQAVMPDREAACRLAEQARALYQSLGDGWGEAWCLELLGTVCFAGGDLDGAQERYTQALTVLQALEDPNGQVWFLILLGRLAAVRGEYNKAMRLYDASMSLSRRQPNRALEAESLFWWGRIFQLCGDLDLARTTFEGSLALCRDLGHPLQLGWVLAGLGDLALDVYDLDRARRWFKEALAVFQTHDITVGAGTVLAVLGQLALFQGRFEAGTHHLRQSLALLREIENPDALVNALTHLAAAHCWSGAFSEAHAPLDEGLTIVEVMDSRPYRVFLAACRAQIDLYLGRYERAHGGAETILSMIRAAGDETILGNLEYMLVSQFATIRTMSLLVPVRGLLGWAALAEGEYARARQAFEAGLAARGGKRDREYTAWALAGLGRAAYGLGERAEAHALLLNALETVVEIRAFIPLMYLIPAISVLLADADDLALQERAIELYALATSQPFVAKAQLFEDIAGRQVAAATASLPPDAVAEAQARGRGLDWWETARELLHELPPLVGSG